MERAASLCDGSVEIVDGVEMFIDKRLVDERPEVFGGLELWTVGRLVDEPDAVGNREVLRAVPTGIVEGENNDAVAPGAGLAREDFEQLGKEWLVDAVRQIPEGFSARRRDEGGNVEPFIAVMAERDRALADGRPDPAMDRLQAEPMLIRRPDLDRLVGMLGGLFGERVGKVFLKTSASAAVAEFGFCGRGDWIDQLIAWSASQPRCCASFSSPS
jgi:hypothetical protein